MDLGCDAKNEGKHLGQLARIPSQPPSRLETWDELFGLGGRVWGLGFCGGRRKSHMGLPCVHHRF